MPWLDILRAIAIAMVIVHHYRGIPGTPSWVRWFALRGYLGVDIFFVLSGWLIGGQLFREFRQTGSVRIGRFWIRRWLRTLPLYYTVLAFQVYTVPLVADRWLTLTFFTQNYKAQHSWLLTWSLCIEEHFYLALPLLILLVARLSSSRPSLTIAFVVTAIATSPLWRWVDFEALAKMNYDHFLAVFYSPTHLRMEGLFLGTALAALHHYRHPIWLWLTKKPWWTFVVGALLFVNAGFNPWLTGFTDAPSERMWFFNAVPQFFLVSLGVTLLIAAGVTLHERGRAMSLPGARWLADHAFALYLVHASTPDWISHGMAFPWRFLASFALAAAIAIALRQLIELPGLRLRNSLLFRERGRD